MSIELKFDRNLAIITLYDGSDNVIDTEFLTDLNSAITKVEEMKSHYLLIISKINGVFSKGLNLIKLSTYSDEQIKTNLIIFNNLLDRISNLNSVAMIDGKCFNEGLELALACKYRYATVSSKFKASSSHLGQVSDRLTFINDSSVRVSKIFCSYEAKKMGIIDAIYDNYFIPDIYKYITKIKDKKHLQNLLYNIKKKFFHKDSSEQVDMFIKRFRSNKFLSSLKLSKFYDNSNREVLTFIKSIDIFSKENIVKFLKCKIRCRVHFENEVDIINIYKQISNTRYLIYSNNTDLLPEHGLLFISNNDSNSIIELIKKIPNIDEKIIAVEIDSLTIIELSAKLGNGENLIGFNFIDNSNIVELTPTELTSKSIIDIMYNLILLMGLIPIITCDTVGRIYNRIKIPYLLEALTLHSEGIAKNYIDNVCKSIGLLEPFKNIKNSNIEDLNNLILNISKSNNYSRSLKVSNRDNFLDIFKFYNGNIDMKSKIIDRLTYRTINEIVHCVDQNIASNDALDFLVSKTTLFYNGNSIFQYIQDIGIDNIISRMKKLQKSDLSYNSANIMRNNLIFNNK